MDLMNKSIKELEKILSEYDISKEEWDVYCKEQNLNNSLSLIIHFDVFRWEEVKYKINKKNRNVNKKIIQTRAELYSCVEKYGLNSEQAKEKCEQVNKYIVTYYRSNKDRVKGRYYSLKDKMGNEYDKAYEYLKSITIDLNEFPSVKKWDEFAKKNNFLGSTSIQYISGLTWHKLRDKVKSDVNFKKFINLEKN